MSDEHAKTVEPRPFNWGKPEKITFLFCVNLLALYAPALFWLRDEPTSSPALGYLCSPFLLALLLAGSSHPLDWFVLLFLVALILLLIWASVALHNSWKAWVAIPTIVFVYSLLQAMAVVSVLHGLNSHG
jgi:hypothetical protein